MLSNFLRYSMPFFIVLSLLTACSDPCDDTVCLNGGACSDGTCVCPDGFTGENCQTTVSNNGGNNGGNNIGPDVQIRITGITASGFPTTNNGSNWDYYTNGCTECNLPDPTWKIVQTSGGGTFNGVGYASNTIGVAVFNSNNGLPIVIELPNQIIGFELWDADMSFDDTSPDLMIGTQFNLYQSALNSGFPSTLIIGTNGSSFQISLTLEYIQ
jgi:hypothetical protein